MYKFNKNYQKPKQNFNDSIKHQLIDYIYSTVDLSQFKYEMLEFEHDLPKLSDKKYYLTANFSGSNCLLVFTKIREKFYAFTIDRKTLSYSRNKVDPNKVDLQFVNTNVDSSIYNGSIFDGVLIHASGKTKFVVSDIYTFKKSDYTNVDLDMKIFELQNYLENTKPETSALNNSHKRYVDLEIGVNKIYPLNKIETFVNKIIPKFADCKIRGICFYPKVSGTKLIFLFGNDKRVPETKYETKYEAKSVKKSPECGQDNDFKDGKLTKYKFISSTSNPVHAILEMKKTDTVDVYKLHSVEKTLKEGKNILMRKKMGIAYIPTLERSQWCRDAMLKAKKNSILVKCLFHNRDGKWEPIEVDEKARFPTFFSMIDVEIVQVSDSDED
jgi:hypothetical protein